MFAAVPLKWEILISMISLGTGEQWRKSERRYLRDKGQRSERERKKGKKTKTKPVSAVLADLVLCFETQLNLSDFSYKTWQKQKKN